MAWGRKQEIERLKAELARAEETIEWMDERLADVDRVRDALVAVVVAARIGLGPDHLAVRGDQDLTLSRCQDLIRTDGVLNLRPGVA